jgi:hypothetical protein
MKSRFTMRRYWSSAWSISSLLPKSSPILRRQGKCLRQSWNGTLLRSSVDW